MKPEDLIIGRTYRQKKSSIFVWDKLIYIGFEANIEHPEYTVYKFIYPDGTDTLYYYLTELEDLEEAADYLNL